jgi:hypothetical protein
MPGKTGRAKTNAVSTLFPDALPFGRL